MIRILGIDPGSVITGYGVIESDGQRNIHLTHGHIRMGGDSLPVRLGTIFREITQLIDQWQPDEMAVEQIFVSNNAMAALTLGQARGAAICAGIHGELNVSEYTPRVVKLAVVGTGGADKAQVQHMVGVLLNLQCNLQSDAADGLAIAICHGHSRSSPPSLLERTPQRRARRRR